MQIMVQLSTIEHLTLGQFYIHTSLLEPHTTQRELDEQLVESLCKDFVIGNGDGWKITGLPLS